MILYDWLAELRPGYWKVGDITVFEPLYLFVLLGPYLPDDVREHVNLEDCSAEIASEFLLDVLADQLVIKELLVAEYFEGWSIFERSLILAEIGDYGILAFRSTSGDDDLIEAFALGSADALICHLRKQPRELLQPIPKCETRMVRVVNRDLTGASAAEVAAIAGCLTRQHVDGCLVVSQDSIME